MASLGDQTNYNNWASGPIFAESVDTIRDQTLGDYYQEDFWTFPISTGGPGIGNFLNGHSYAKATEQRSNYSDINGSNQWVWRQPGTARLTWYVNPMITNQITITVQRMKTGANATVKLIENSALGVAEQILQDTNTGSTSSHDIILSCTPTSFGFVWVELEYLVPIEFTSDVVYWGGDLHKHGGRFMLGKLYNQNPTHEVSGNVQDDSVNVARQLAVHRQDSKELIATTTSNGTTGNYIAQFAYSGDVYVVCFDDDGDKQALVEDRITPGVI